MEYYSAIKKNEILPFATTWMDLEGIMLNKSDRERQHVISYVESKKQNKQTKQNENRLIETEKK